MVRSDWTPPVVYSKQYSGQITFTVVEVNVGRCPGKAAVMPAKRAARQTSTEGGSGGKSKSKNPCWRPRVEGAFPCRPNGGNIMYDQRIHRGSNFRSVVTVEPPPRPKRAAKPFDCGGGDGGGGARKKGSRAKEVDKTQPVPGRAHADTQFEPFPAELLDVRSYKKDGTQTDFLRECTPPLPVEQLLALGPVSTGVDVSTQVAVCDLDEFEAEAFPTCEMLVAKTVQLSVTEVLYEDEMVQLRRKQQAAEMRQLTERLRFDWEEDCEAKRRAVAAKTLDRLERAVAAEKLTQKTVGAQAVADWYAGGLCDNAVGQLQSDKYFRGPDLLSDWVLDQLAKDSQRRADNEVDLRNMVNDVLVNRDKLHGQTAVGTGRGPCDNEGSPSPQ
ncbi:uncharacterized protein LOC126836991 [Adelges cooleyi]|uniref:uncharacterized protein LOC126836991 n=1 Tax=Adelges cooleyi TaxID=133065 RepID=UPI00217FA596|nr:uncharacterized protein LOC126836991 [Adelges cooleyi]